MNNQVVIIGYGVVGKAYYKHVFPNAYVYDPFLKDVDIPRISGAEEEYRDPNFQLDRRLINRHCDIALVCVPTPMTNDGSCDTSIVEEVVDWLKTPLIVIKSTVSPGTTDRLKKKTGKIIVMSPEYIRETKFPSVLDAENPKQHGFIIIGGTQTDCSKYTDLLLPIMGPSCRFRFMTALEAELVKYMENTWLGLKVLFANEMRGICDVFGANYHVVREGWLDDPRVGASHSAAFKQAPGFRGKCLPKDISALIAACDNIGYDPILLRSVLAINNYLKENNNE